MNDYMNRYLGQLKQTLTRFRQASVSEKCDMLAFLFLCLFFFDCSFAGGGRYILIGPFSPRMLIAFAAFGLSLPRLFKDFGKYIKNPILLSFGAFLVYLLVCAVRGYLAQNNRQVLITDLKGFAWLFIVPAVMATVRTKLRFRKVLSSIVAGAVVLSCMVLAINAFCSWVDKGVLKLYYPVFFSQLGSVGIISDNIYRIFMNSCPYLIFACSIALFRQIQCKKVMPRYVAVIVACLCAVLLSFTRSAYGCVMVVLAASALMIVLYYRKNMKQHLKFFAITAIVLVVAIFALEFVFMSNYFNFALSRTIGTPPKSSLAAGLRQDLSEFLFPDGPPSLWPSTGSDSPDKDEEENLKNQQQYISTTLASDQLRAVTQADLMVLIRQNPIFGNGLGASAPSRKDGLDEYFYLDMLARTGVVGLILYLLPFGLIVLFSIKNRKNLVASPAAVSALCGMLGFWAITWFNPWMNAVLGIAGYGLCCAVPHILSAEESASAPGE